MTGGCVIGESRLQMLWLGERAMDYWRQFRLVDGLS
jgi:hypothetical protein